MKKTLGVLCLENAPIKIAGSMGDPASYAFPVIYETVKGATAEKVTRCDDTLLAEYRLSAGKLVERGAAAITGNCGFTAIFQKALAASVPVPVLMSTLVLIPFVRAFVSDRGKIGILTFNGPSLKENYFKRLAVDPGAQNLAVKGVEEKSSWRELLKLTPKPDVNRMREDLLEVCRELVAENEKVEAVILECTAMPPFHNDVFRAVKAPVFDIIYAAHALVESISERS